MKGGSSPGIDGFTSELIKRFKDQLAAPIKEIANRSFRENNFPAIYKRALLIPLYKKGDPEDMNNYRPISLLSVIAKIIERLAKNYFVEFLEEHSLISGRQFGFRKGRSTDDAIGYMTRKVLAAMDDGNKVICIYQDLAKAFDTVSHVKLVQLLSTLVSIGDSLSGRLVT